MLKKQTEEIWHRLEQRPELQGFVLVGRSALALQIHHRESEDLDFAWPQFKLPRPQLDLLKENLHGLEFVPMENASAVREAQDCDLNFADYHQNYLIEEVRTTFFTLEKEERRVVGDDVSRPLRIATLDEIFSLKTLLCSKRSKSRDWFDLYILMRDYGYTFEQLYQVFVNAGSKYSYDIAVSRLSSGRPPKLDEGFSALVKNPPTISDMNEFFNERKNAYEVSKADSEARRKRDE